MDEDETSTMRFTSGDIEKGDYVVALNDDILPAIIVVNELFDWSDSSVGYTFEY